MLIERKLHNIDLSKLTLSSRAYSFKTKIDKVDCLSFGIWRRIKLWSTWHKYSREYSEGFDEYLHWILFEPRRMASGEELVEFLPWLRSHTSDNDGFMTIVTVLDRLFPELNFKEIYNDDSN